MKLQVNTGVIKKIFKTLNGAERYLSSQHEQGLHLKP